MILFLIAVILGVILYPIGIIYSVIKHISDMFKTLAIGINQFGNVTCSLLFNDTLIKKGGYQFGNPDDTISRVLGKNKITGTLTKAGKALADLLNFIDKNHVENAAK